MGGGGLEVGPWEAGRYLLTSGNDGMVRAWDLHLSEVGDERGLPKLLMSSDNWHTNGRWEVVLGLGLRSCCMLYHGTGPMLGPVPSLSAGASAWCMQALQSTRAEAPTVPPHALIQPWPPLSPHVS